MATPIKSTLDFESAARIINLLDPATPQEPATRAYVDALVEGLAWKDSVRVRAATNVNLAAPGATVDGITMATGDRFIATGQTVPAEGGIYVWNGAATPATRSLDANTANELEKAVSTVEEGTSAGSTFLQSTVNFTLGSGAVSWIAFGTSAPAASETTAGIAELATQAETDAGADDLRIVTPLKLATYANRAKRFAQTFGDGSATSYVITHNLGTLDVTCSVWETGGSKRLAGGIEVQATSANSVTIVTAAAVAASALRAVITA
jgi:hypothetical protein